MIFHDEKHNKVWNLSNTNIRMFRFYFLHKCILKMYFAFFLQNCFQMVIYDNSSDDINAVKVACSPADQGFMEIFIFLRNNKKEHFCDLITST